MVDEIVGGGEAEAVIPTELVAGGLAEVGSTLDDERVSDACDGSGAETLVDVAIAVEVAD